MGSILRLLRFTSFSSRCAASFRPREKSITVLQYLFKIAAAHPSQVLNVKRNRNCKLGFSLVTVEPLYPTEVYPNWEWLVASVNWIFVNATQSFISIMASMDLTNLTSRCHPVWIPKLEYFRSTLKVPSLRDHKFLGI